MAISFKEATDRVGVPAVELAGALGVSVQKVRQARLDPGNAGHRIPPEGWEAVIARLARERRDDLDDLAEELEARAGDRKE